MKRIVVIKTVLVVFLLFCCALPASAAPSVYLNLLDSPMGYNDTFEVEVWADGDGLGLELMSFGFDVSSDMGNIFTYDGYTLGEGFDDDSGGGPLNVSGSAFPGFLEDEVLLATLAFTINAIGSDTLNVIGLYDEEFFGLFYETPDMMLTGYNINSSLEISTVPVPGAVLLMFSGLLGLAATNRRTNS